MQIESGHRETPSGVFGLAAGARFASGATGDETS